MKKKSPLTRARTAYRKGGGLRLAKGATEYGLTKSRAQLRRASESIGGVSQRARPNRKTFRFGSRRLGYFIHPYNTTWKNERAVEIPIVKTYLKGHRDPSVLEFGNVWGRYFKHQHDVIDKYEQWPGVINQDIVDFRPSRTYDLVFSISTLEHVGWDEDQRDPLKTVVALQRLYDAVAPGGTLLVTFEVGYNPFLDYLLDVGRIPFDQRHCLKRVSRWNDWEPGTWEEIRHMKYGQPYNSANGLVILELQKPKRGKSRHVFSTKAFR